MREKGQPGVPGDKRLHGGEVSVESVLSEGTTFRIELPRG